MRTQILLSVLLLTTGLTQAQTQVPNTLQAGQPARAADVNENFSALAGSINQMSTEVAALDGRLGLLETTGSSGCNAGVSSGWLSAHTITYSYIPAAVGTPITVGGGTGWVLVRVPFVEYGSGLRYILDLPMVTGAQVDLHFSHVKPVNPSCAPLLISGFPASADVSDGRTYTWSQPFRGVSTESRYDVSTTIWVGETAVTVSTGITFPELNIALGSDTYDYTFFPLAEMPHIDDFINSFDDFIDYLHIEEAP